MLNSALLLRKSTPFPISSIQALQDVINLPVKLLLLSKLIELKPSDHACAMQIQPVLGNSIHWRQNVDTYKSMQRAERNTYHVVPIDELYR